MEQRNRRWIDTLIDATRLRAISIGVSVILMLVLTSLVVGHLRRVEREELSAEFEIQAVNAFNRLQTQFDVYLETVQSISSLHAAESKLERKPFAAFVARTISQYNGINGLGWNPRVKQAERAAFEQAARDDGLSDFQLKQWTPGSDNPWTASDEPWADEYVPAYLLEPYEQNKSAIGIDVASNPTRFEALQRARDSGRAVATARITLAQGNSEQAGFLIFAPVYEVGKSTENINDRRENLAGFAVGVFRVGDIVDQAMAGLKFNDMELRITDQTADKDGQVLFTGAPSPDSRNAQLASFDASSFLSQFDYEVGGRDWKFEFAATPQYIEEKSRGHSWVILATGIFSSILLGVVLQLVIGRASQVEELVRLRTEQLRDANSKLEQEMRDRELAQQELHEKAAELEKSNAHLMRFNTSASGRELRMIELKREINELLEGSGKPTRYDTTFAEK